jgi:hypothetical protein
MLAELQRRSNVNIMWCNVMACLVFSRHVFPVWYACRPLQAWAPLHPPVWRIRPRLLFLLLLLLLLVLLFSLGLIDELLLKRLAEGNSLAAAERPVLVT